MKRWWQTYTVLISVGALLSGLAVLGLLQYRWLTQINAAESEKEHARVQEQADRFASDLNRTLQSVYTNFQASTTDWSDDGAKVINERLDYWKTNSEYPALVKDVYFFKPDEGEPAKHLDLATRELVNEPLPDDLAGVSKSAYDDKPLASADAEHFALFIPIIDPQPRLTNVTFRRDSIDKPRPEIKRDLERISKPFGYIVVRLDESVIKEKIIPDLTAKYFGDGDYNVGVADNNGRSLTAMTISGNADGAAGVFDLSPDKFMIFMNRTAVPATSVTASTASDGAKKTIVLDSHVESRVVTGDGDAKGKMTVTGIKLQGTTADRVFSTTTSDAAGKPPWLLQVQHISGSLDNYFASVLRKNLAIGFGLLMLIAVAVGAVIISTFRMRMLAQKQVDFVSSVSHEFRTPLAVIYSAGENLADGVTRDHEQVTGYGEMIKAEGRKLSAMVEQILDLAGANAGKRKFDLKPTDLNSVIETAVEDCRPLIDAKQMMVESDVPELPPIIADRTAITQAMQNLIANSIKYSNGSNWIRISAKGLEDKVAVSVEDRGIGISRGELKQIFEPFYRSRVVVDAQIHGNGLGLSIVRQILDAHGGDIKVASELGKGSVFTIELPLTAGQNAADG